MLNVVYLVLVMNTNSAAPTSQMIPQANMHQCMLNKKAYDEKALKSTNNTSYAVKIRATCVTGVK